MKIQRTLAPTAAPLDWVDLWRGIMAPFEGTAVVDKLTREFQEYFGMQHVFWVTSGKAALTLILLGLKRLSMRRKVVIPAYTCYSVPSSIRKAGLEVALCDVDSATLDFNMADLKCVLDKDVLAVIPTHLLGCCADVAQVRRYADDKHIYVIEDVAQSFGALKEGKPLGTKGDVAFLSFGRGKNITCGSGGVILTNSDSIAQAIRSEYEHVETESFAEGVRSWIEVAAMSLLIVPAAYWIPAGLPFLKLGETKFYHDFPIRRMGRIRAGLLSNWKTRLSRSTTARIKRASDLMRGLKDSPLNQVTRGLQPSAESVQLRFPVLMKNKEKRSRICALSKRQGLGISHFYPTAIQEIPELQSSLAAVNAPGASILADCLITLPTHDYVTQRDIDRITAVVQAVQYEMGDSVEYEGSAQSVPHDLPAGEDR